MASYQLQWKRRCLSLLPWLLHLMVEEMQRHLELFALLMFSSRAAGFSRELWWFCMCFCIVLVLAAVSGIVFLQCLHIVFVLSVTLSPFLISTGKPKCCHTNDLNVAGGSSILISPSRSIMLTSQLTTRQLFTSTRNLVASNSDQAVLNDCSLHKQCVYQQKWLR